MASSITALNAGPLYSLAQTQQALQTDLQQQSTGKQINSPADNPSGYAIATSLQVQAAALNAASSNVQDAYNASQVASSAIGQVSGIVSQLNTLAVRGADDFLSPTDRAALQDQANQLVQQANTIAQQTSFNGVSLLSGAYAGPQAGTPASATVTNNDAVAQGGTVVSQVSAANPNFQNSTGAAQGFGGNATTDSTIQIQVVNANGQAEAVASVVDSATGQTVTSGPVAAGGTISGFENVNVTIGNITNADIGQTATIQIAQNVPANTQNNALVVQSGSAQGATTNVALPGVSSSTLQISNINLSSSLNATNAIGQLTNAQTTLTNALSQLGGQQNALLDQINNNDVTANNLTDAQSSIQDANIGQSVTNSTLAQIQSQIAIAVLAQNNTLASGVLGLFRSA